MHRDDRRALSTKLIVRSALPSSTSLAYSMLASLTLIGAQVLLLTLGNQTYSTPLHDAFLQSYNTYLHDPLRAILHNNPLNTILLIVLWGMFAWMVFELISRIVTAILDWRTLRREISLPNGGAGFATPHPMARSFGIRILWQAIILVMAFVLSILLQPFVHYIFIRQQRVLHESVKSIALAFGLSTLLWMIVMHCYVVLVRWYLGRTRVTGEILR
jgi:hypothetical protein